MPAIAIDGIRNGCLEPTWPSETNIRPDRCHGSPDSLRNCQDAKAALGIPLPTL